MPENINADNNRELTADDLKKLIAEKNLKRPIDCRVILDYFDEFLLQLDNKRKEHTQELPFRVQVLCNLDRSEGDNWTALDIQVSESGIHIFYLNAAGDPSSLNVITNSLKNFPHVQMTCCEGDIQRDWVNCAIFALDHVFHMSKIADLHTQILDRREKEPPDATKNIYKFKPANLPAVLVKNMQSLRALESYILKQDNPQEKINKKDQTLREYVDRHTFFSKELGIRVNTAIEHKSEIYRARLKDMK